MAKLNTCIFFNIKYKFSSWTFPGNIIFLLVFSSCFFLACLFYIQPQGSTIINRCMCVVKKKNYLLSEQTLPCEIHGIFCAEYVTTLHFYLIYMNCFGCRNQYPPWRILITAHFEIQPSFESRAVIEILSLSEITKKSSSPHIINPHIKSFPAMCDAQGQRNA